MSLPILANLEDVQAIVDHLRTDPAAVTIKETHAIAEEKNLCPRKINANEIWGLASKEGNRVKLNSLGFNLSRAKSEVTFSVYVQFLYNMNPYESVIQEKLFHRVPPTMPLWTALQKDGK